MSRAELRQPAVKWQEMQWATAPAPDDEEESEIVAQFLTLPYSYQSDQLDQEESHELGLGGNGVRACSSSMSMYWPPADHGAACCWPSGGDSSRSAGAVGGGGYFDDGCCYDYLGKPDVSLGINTLSCSAAINLNLAGEEEIGSECARLVPDDPSPAVRVRAGYLNDGDVMRLQPKRKVQAGQEGWDLGRCKKKARPADHKKQGKKAVSNTVKKCSSSGSSHCSDNESNCSQEKRSAEDHVAGGGGGTAKARASRGSATDPQSLYAKRRRERINDRLRMLQKLVPNGTKVDISTMLEEAVLYVKFLQQQIKMLSSDEMWMYAPIAYNGMSLGIDLRIPLPH